MGAVAVAEGEPPNLGSFSETAVSASMKQKHAPRRTRASLMESVVAAYNSDSNLAISTPKWLPRA